MTIVALLPMKAHSERVHGKNFRNFNGKPLFRWMLDTLLGTKEIDRVVINTDARDVLRRYGLEESPRVVVRDRKREICGDLISMNVIVADDVANVPADIYLMTHVTNPLLSTATIRAALARYVEALTEGSADSLFAVNRVQMRFYRQDGSPVNHDPSRLVRTQDLEPWYEENSSLYLFNRRSMAATGTRIGKQPILFETPELESIDIDTPEDWTIAELVCREVHGRAGAGL